MAEASSRVLFFSRLTEFSIPLHKPPSYSNNILTRPLLPCLSIAAGKRPDDSAVVRCRISGVDGGGVFDESISTQKFGSFDRELSVVANMLKTIDPLDTSVISKGVSDLAKDAMRQMISTMLGLLPSDQFSVTVRVSRRPLHRLLASSLITGYTLWNAEYRIMLTRNFEASPSDMLKWLNSGDHNEASENQIEENERVSDDSVGKDRCSEESERLNLQDCLVDLSPEAMNYIQELESELSTVKQELHTQKHETATESNNDLLKYLRSLDPDMMNELSRPSSSEVTKVLKQLVQCTYRKLFKDSIASSLMVDSEVRIRENYKSDNLDFCDTRDYLAKLLFWCMLLGNHLRGLENRLHLSCAVSLL